MNTVELAITVVASAVAILAIGFLVGMGYQQMEDRVYVRSYKKECDRFVKEATKVRREYINKAYALGRKHEREAIQAKAERDWQDLMTSLDGNFKIGGF